MYLITNYSIASTHQEQSAFEVELRCWVPPCSTWQHLPANNKTSWLSHYPISPVSWQNICGGRFYLPQSGCCQRNFAKFLKIIIICDSASRCLQKGEGPSRSLLRAHWYFAKSRWQLCRAPDSSSRGTQQIAPLFSASGFPGTDFC